MQVMSQQRSADRVYTVGHSTHSITQFINLLKQHNIEVVADVRSVPHSNRFPHFNREDLKAALRETGMRYVFLGNELGGRPKDPDCFQNGIAQYDRMSRTKQFQSGIERLLSGLSQMSVALMCSEQEPLTCHRALLIAKHLDELGIDVLHIHADGRLEHHHESMRSLSKKLGLDEPDLFEQPSRDSWSRAYQLQSEKFAFKKPAQSKQPRKHNVYTIGFTKKSATSFFEMIADSNIKRVVDVRLNNVSQLAGFAKRDDLAYFLRRLCNVEYVHVPLLAPTQEILDAFKKHKGSWEDYEKRFLELMSERKIETELDQNLFEQACLLCSEHEPVHCHRRLVIEYLQHHWGKMEVEHLGFDMARPQLSLLDQFHSS